MPVYRDLDVDGVWREYLPSLRVPDFMAVLDECSMRGAEARRTLPCQRVSYGEHADEWMWFTPGPSADAPVVVFVHGGYWHLLSADDGSFLAPAVIESGCAFASINYTLCPHATIPVLVDQVHRAVVFLSERSNAPVHVVGHSAGAHLAASVAQAGAPAASHVFVSGVYDIRPLVYTPDNDDIRLTAADAARWSPLLSTASFARVPAVVVCGGDESSEFLRQSREWAAMWGATGTSVVATGRHHFDVLFDLFDASTEVGAAVRQQVLGAR